MKCYYYQFDVPRFKKPRSKYDDQLTIYEVCKAQDTTEFTLDYDYEHAHTTSNYHNLSLKKLLNDLFIGNTLVDASAVGKRKKRATEINVKAFMESNISHQDFIKKIFYFKSSRNEYQSRFLNKKSNNNQYAIQLYDIVSTNDTVTSFLNSIELRCEEFLNNGGCKVLDTELLNEYLCSRIEIFIEYVEKCKPDTIRGLTEDLKDKSIQRLRLDLKENQSNTTFLLSRILILAGVLITKVNYNLLLSLLTGYSTVDNKCDEFYLKYIENNKTNADDIINAFDNLKKSGNTSIYSNEIKADFAEYALTTNNPQLHKKAFSKLVPTVLANPDYSNGRFYYLISQFYERGLGTDVSADQCKWYLKKAVDLNNVDALYRLAKESYGTGDSKKIEDAIKICKIILEQSHAANEPAYANAALMIAKSLEENKENAEEYYRIAARCGLHEAQIKLKLIERKSNKTNSSKETINYTKTFIISPENNAALSPEDREKVISGNIRTRLEEIVKTTYEKNEQIAFVFTDEDNCLDYALYLLDLLYEKCISIAINEPQNAEKRIAKIIKSTDIFLYTKDYETTAMVIDESLKAMVIDLGSGKITDKVYFRVHIREQSKELARRLLCQAPLFIPCIKSKNSTPYVVTFGESDFIYNFIREATASSFMTSKKVNIASITDENSTIGDKFKRNCHGIYSVRLDDKIMPEFFHLNLNDPNLADIVSAKTKKAEDAEEIVKSSAESALAQGNYFVVDIGTDIENLAFARDLRAWLLRSTHDFSRIPFIAVRCRNSESAFWMNRLSIGGSGEKQWFNNYDLFIIQDEDTIASPAVNITEKIALAIHRTYFGNDADYESDFWRSTYNQDSSKASAVGLLYRFFDVGIHLENYTDYHNLTAAKLNELATRYDAIMYKEGEGKNESESLITAAKCEQCRWNCYMLTRGWLPATAEQVRVYMYERKSNSHKQELSKLHPYILDWKDLDERGETSFNLLKKELGGKVKSPKTNNNHAVEKAPTFCDGEE